MPIVSAGPVAPGAHVDLGWGRVVVGPVIGDGGMGTVFRGWLYYNPHGQLGGQPPHEVAVKVLHASLSARPHIRRLFLGEAEALARLSHPNIVHFHALVEGDQLALVLELVEGEALDAVIARHVARATPGGLPAMPFLRAWHYFQQLLGALAATHELGIVHRDVKPANLLLRRDGLAKLGDFGIARLPADAARSSGGMQPGTGAYMSPEQVTGASLDGRSDLYSAAIVLYEMLAGKTPFDVPGRTEVVVRAAQVDEYPPTLTTFVPQAPPVIDMLFARALAKDPAHRFPTAIELGNAFRQAIAIPDTTGWQAQQALARGAQGIAGPAPGKGATAKIPQHDADRMRQAVAGAYRSALQPTGARATVPADPMRSLVRTRNSQSFFVRACIVAAGLSASASALAQGQPGDPRQPLMPPAAPPPATTSTPPASPPSGAMPIAPPGAPGTAPPTEQAGGQIGAKPSDVYAEDWWSHTRPLFELHGYYRLRAELFHNFALGRNDQPDTALWTQPVDYDYADNRFNTHTVNLCGKDPANPSAGGQCANRSQASANMRFRMNPELHISDNLRILSQVDLLDNLVLGSTPAGYYNQTGTGGAQVVGPPSPYAPRGVFSSTQEAPVAGVNSDRNSITVKRVWGEYMTPVGLLRFGRMPSHWGLGVLANSGDGYDSDYQSTADRIMFVTGIKSLDLYFSAMWDFANEGAISRTPHEQQGQPYDLGQLDDVNQYAVAIVRRRAPDLAKRDLAEGRAVINGGAYVVYRNQYLANDSTGDPSTGASISQTSHDNLQRGFVRRGAEVIIPDLWVQARYRKFRFEAEAVTIQGSLENTQTTPGASDYVNSTGIGKNGWKIRQYMLVTQTELKAVEDKLRLQFGFGWASGDPDLEDGSIAPRAQQLQPQRTYDRTFSMARMHPDYRVDLILFRNILSRVQGAYYFRPSVDYDFTRSMNGQKIGGGAAVIWSRASEFVQAPGHKRDLGVELDLQLYYQSKDGSLNDDPDKMGGFYTMIQYGVLFPLGGLGYQPQEVTDARAKGITLDTGAAQILRWYMGILF